ncbi:MAG: hypothetical protein PHU71_01300 [Candidatus Gracilibacteria bacterium]|nr:hypothetical protein [Candidatus Gracilibacteria bacterium]
MNFFMGLIGVVAGFFYVKYSKNVADSLGRMSWAEKWLGAGGTYSFHKIVGIIIIVISFMWMTGTFQLLLVSFLGPLMGA